MNEEEEEDGGDCAAKEKDNYFLLLWDEKGLDALADITLYYNHVLAESIRYLVGEKPKASEADRILSQMLLRARFNPHRHPEVYGLRTSVSAEALKEAFDTSPQETALLVRQKGVSFLRGGPRKKEDSVIFAEEKIFGDADGQMTTDTNRKVSNGR